MDGHRDAAAALYNRPPNRRSYTGGCRPGAPQGFGREPRWSGSLRRAARGTDEVIGGRLYRAVGATRRFAAPCAGAVLGLRLTGP